ncbi:hypothetical protein BDR26DRAFT_875772 [Obelidium mucronatum]|nr:hypothetical protein BDR26DRAFT_875772 [Obelidium mucronatum]
MDAIIANLPPLPESPAFAFVTDVPQSSSAVEVTATQDLIDVPNHATAPIDVTFPLTPTTTPATLATFPTTVPAQSVVTETIAASTPASLEEVTVQTSTSTAFAEIITPLHVNVPVVPEVAVALVVASPSPFAPAEVATSVSVKDRVRQIEDIESTTAGNFPAARLPTAPSPTTATNVYQSAELSTAADLVSLPPPPPSTTTVHQSAELSTAADLISLASFRDLGEGDDVDAMFIDMPDTEAPVYCLGNDWAAEMAEAEEHEEAMVEMLTACLQGNVLDDVAPAAEQSLVPSDAAADTDLFAFCEITSTPVEETGGVAEGIEAEVLFGDADVVMQEAVTHDDGLMEAAIVEDRPQLAESLKRRQFREPASIAKRHARAARETAVRLEVSVAVEADEEVVIGTVENPQPEAPRVARKEYSWAARVERLALAARRSPVPSQQGLDGPAVAVVARSAEEANPLDIFASVCCAQAVVLPRAMEEIDRLAEIEAQAPVALTLLSEARQILDAIEPEEDMTEEDLDDLFSE